MRRHIGLVPLSSHHQNALVQAKRLRDPSLAKDEEARRAAAETFVAFFQTNGREHFREEEEILLPALGRLGEAWTPDIQEMLHQHLLIRAKVADLEANLREGYSPTENDLCELGILLDRHVRLEERRIFPYIEKVLPESELRKLREVLEKSDD
jgi:hemerythrin-like domain-containing protein